MSRLVKLQRRYGSDWYLENDDGDVAWVAPMVKEHIERLEDENEKLHKEIELVGHIAVSNVSASIGREESLEDENAKLRKVCAEMYPYARAYTQLGVNLGCNDSVSYDWYLQLRELGIEVPE